MGTEGVENELACSACSGRSSGVLTLSKTGILWRSRETEAQKKVAKDDVSDMRWCAVGQRHFHVKVTTRSGRIVRFTELNSRDVHRVRKYVEDVWDHIVEEETLAGSGGNWGHVEVQGGALHFVVHKQTGVGMEIPLDLIALCAMPGKHEVELQFHDDDTVEGDEEALVEMRLHVPGDAPATDDRATTMAERLRNEIVDRAHIRHATGKAIVELDEAKGTFLTPRGRYAIDFFHSFLRMHGKTYDYKILYANISRCFVLDMPSSTNVAFVISLDVPIRQGKQAYPHLVMQLATAPDMHVDVNLSPEDLAAFNLHSRMTGSLPQLVATVFRQVAGKRVFTSGSFLTHLRARAVKCAVKANAGLLFPLEKSLVFVHNPATYIRYSDVTAVEFQRYSGQSGSSLARNFDLVVTTRGVGQDDDPRDTVFSAIDRREFPELSQYLAARKLPIVSKLTKPVDPVQPLARLNEAEALEEGEVDDDSDDSDFDQWSEDEGREAKPAPGTVVTRDGKVLRHALFN